MFDFVNLPTRVKTISCWLKESTEGIGAISDQIGISPSPIDQVLSNLFG
jgi:hypothetical protein